MDDELYDDLMEVYAQGLVTCYGCGDDANGGEDNLPSLMLLRTLIQTMILIQVIFRKIFRF